MNSKKRVNKKPAKLKRCPFCGGAAELTPNNVKEYYVRCTICGAMSNDMECGDPVCATKRWNKRAKTMNVGSENMDPPTKKDIEERRKNDLDNKNITREMDEKGITDPWERLAYAMSRAVNEIVEKRVKKEGGQG